MSDIRIGIIGHDDLSVDYQGALQSLIAQDATVITPIAQSPYSETQTALADAKAQHGLNAVIVAGSKAALAETICDALQLGLHVFSAHPIPRTIEEMIQIRSAEHAARGQVLQFGFTVREHDSVRSALTRVAGQAYGKLLTLRAVHGLSALPPSENAMTDSGGGILIGPGAHMVDLMQAFAGPFEEIKALTQNHLSPHSGVEDNVFAMLRTHTDVLASLHASATQWRETFRLELGFEQGFLWLEGLLSEDHGFGQEVLIYGKTGDPTSGPRHETVERFEHSNGVLSALEAFLAAMLDPALPRIGTSQQAFDTLNTIQRIYAADQTFTFGSERQAS